MPLADSAVLSMVRLLRGLILAPDESRMSCNLFAMPLTSKPFRGMTLSRSFTGQEKRHKVQTFRELIQTLTVESPCNRLLVCPLLDDKFDMGICACHRLEVVVDVSACVGRRGPGVAELDDDLADLGNEGHVPVCGVGGELCAEEGAGGGPGC